MRERELVILSVLSGLQNLEEKTGKEYEFGKCLLFFIFNNMFYNILSCSGENAEVCINCGESGLFFSDIV